MAVVVIGYFLIKNATPFSIQIRLRMVHLQGLCAVLSEIFYNKVRKASLRSREPQGSSPMKYNEKA